MNWGEWVDFARCSINGIINVRNLRSNVSGSDKSKVVDVTYYDKWKLLNPPVILREEDKQEHFNFQYFYLRKIYLKESHKDVLYIRIKSVKLFITFRWSIWSDKLYYLSMSYE